MNLYSNRSVSGSIKAAYNLYSGNLKKVLRLTWLPALVFAVLQTALLMFVLPDKRVYEIGMSNIFVSLAVAIVLTIAGFVAASWLLAKTVAMLNANTAASYFRRAMVSNAIPYIYIILLSLIVVELLPLLSTKLQTAFQLGPETLAFVNVVTAIAVTLLATAAVIPFIYSSFKYIINPDTPLLHLFSKDYAVGFRHWGHLFLMGLIVSLIMMVIALIVTLPFCIILVAHIENQTGMLLGDADGTPGYFTPMFVVVTILTLFVVTYEIIWAIVVQYFVYGTITTQETERKKHLKEINNDEATENTVH